jgi:hypothetical protein
MVNHVVNPTYDPTHYLARAQRYASEAQHEPDSTIKATLTKLAAACQQKAAGAPERHQRYG